MPACRNSGSASWRGARGAAGTGALSASPSLRIASGGRGSGGWQVMHRQPFGSRRSVHQLVPSQARHQGRAVWWCRVRPAKSAAPIRAGGRSSPTTYLRSSIRRPVGVQRGSAPLIAVIRQWWRRTRLDVTCAIIGRTRQDVVRSRAVLDVAGMNRLAVRSACSQQRQSDQRDVTQ
jgi:hypothetical protein